MINLDSTFKIRDITLPTKVRLVKAMVFPVVMHGPVLFATPWSEACQIALSTVFPRQEYWRGLLCPPPGTTGKTIALTRQTLVGKVMSLLLNMLSR